MCVCVLLGHTNQNTFIRYIRRQFERVRLSAAPSDIKFALDVTGKTDRDICRPRVPPAVRSKTPTDLLRRSPYPSWKHARTYIPNLRVCWAIVVIYVYDSLMIWIFAFEASAMASVTVFVYRQTLYI